jgi:multimeric flavodoxin WrbA
MSKKIILHDLPLGKIETLLSGIVGENTVFPAFPTVRQCVGCFECWFSTSGVCVLNDRCKEFSSMISGHNEIVVISRMVFGGLSPAIKIVLERCIGHLLPFFRIVNGEMHHVLRHEHKFELRYIFYGQDVGTREKEIAQRLTAANAHNLGAEKWSAHFYSTPDEIEVA